jgi:DNA end-binding protein Ku
MKASWSGYLCIGSLNVPVKLYSAVRSPAHTFVQIHERDGSPISRIAKCIRENKEIDSSEIVRAVERNGKYITISDEEVALSTESDKTIRIHQFSEPSFIKSKFYDKPYYVVPEEGGELAYTILRQAFVKTKKIAIAKYRYYQKEYIGILSIDEGLIMLQQVRFATDLASRSDIKAPSLPQPLPAHVDVAADLMERYSTPFYIEDYTDERATSLEELVDRKAKGLGPKRKKSLAPKATKEQSVIPILNELLQSKNKTGIPAK